MEYNETTYNFNQLVAQLDENIKAAEAEMTFDDMLNSIAYVTLDH